MSIVSEINRIKTNIANAYDEAEEKGATMPVTLDSSNLANTIASISSGSEEWQPHEDWWDIDTILEEDTENYQGKIIALIGDEVDTITIYGRNASKIKTSDGSIYNNTQTSSQQATTYTHTWDKTKDKPCSVGYSTRYIIWYYENTEVNISPQYYENSIYMIFSGMSINYNTNGNNPPFTNLKALQALKGKNTVFNNSNIFFGNDYNLTYLDGFSLKNNIDYLLSLAATNLKKIPNWLNENNVKIAYNGLQLMSNLEEIENIIIGGGNTTNDLKRLKKIKLLNWESLDCRNICNNAYLLEEIDELRLPANPAQIYGFGSCFSLRNIGKINVINFAINLSNSILLNHDTLIRILNALYDYSEDSGTHTITLGANNLAKLTEEEIEIGTDKGWTIS